MEMGRSKLLYLLATVLFFAISAQARELPPQELLYQIEEFLSEETEDYVELVLTDAPKEKKINGTLIDSGIGETAFHILVKPGPLQIYHHLRVNMPPSLWITLPQKQQFDSVPLKNTIDFFHAASSNQIFKHPPYLSFIKKISPVSPGENKTHNRYATFPLDVYHPETSPLPTSLPHNLMVHRMDKSFFIDNLKLHGHLYNGKIKFRIEPLWRAKTFLHSNDVMYHYLTNKANVWIDDSPYSSPLSPKVTRKAAREIDRLQKRLKKVEANQKKIAQKKGSEASAIKRTGARVPTLKVELSPYQKLLLIAKAPESTKQALTKELEFSLNYGPAAFARLGTYKPNLLKPLISFMGQTGLQGLTRAMQSFYVLDASIVTELRQILFSATQDRPSRSKDDSLLAIHKALLVSDWQMEVPATQNHAKFLRRIFKERSHQKTQFPYTFNDQETIKEYRKLESCYFQQIIKQNAIPKTDDPCQFPKLTEILKKGPFHLQMGVVDFLVKVEYYPTAFKNLILDLLTRKALNPVYQGESPESEVKKFDFKRSALVLTAAAVGYLRWKAPSYMANLSEKAMEGVFKDAIVRYQKGYSLPPYTLPEDLQESIDTVLSFMPKRHSFEKLPKPLVDKLDNALLAISLAMTSRDISFKDKIYLIWVLYSIDRSNQKIRFNLRDARLLNEGAQPGSFKPVETTMWRHLRNLMLRYQRRYG